MNRQVVCASAAPARHWHSDHSEEGACVVSELPLRRKSTLRQCAQDNSILCTAAAVIAADDGCGCRNSWVVRELF
jgi:hypothetical protein